MHRLSPLLLTSALALSAVQSAAAQDFAVAPVDLRRGGAISDPQLDCAFAIDQVVGWFDRGTQALYVGGRDASGPFSAVALSAAEMDAASGVNVVRCRAADYDAETDVLYLVLATADDTELVLALPSDLDGNLVPEVIASAASGAADGATGIVSRGSRLFVAVKDSRSGTLADGIYSFAPSGTDQTALPVVLDPDLSLVGLTASPTQFGSPAAFSLFAVSDRDGTGVYRNKVVEVRTPTTTAALRVFADPFDGSALTVPSDPAAADLSSVVFAVSRVRDGTSSDFFGAVFVLSRGAGVLGDEIVRYESAGPVTLFATGASIAANLGRTPPAFSAGAGVNALLADEVGYRLYLVNSGPVGGRDEVLVTAGNFATPGEMQAPVLPDPRVQVSPNPFRDRASVSIGGLPAGRVTVRVVDTLGREVAVLHDGPVSGGQVEMSLEARGLAAGVYGIQVQTPSGMQVRTATLVR